MLATEHGGLSVDGKAHTIRAELPHTEAEITAILLVDAVGEAVQSRVKFAPLVVRLLQGNRHRSHTAGISCQLRLERGNAVLLIVLHNAALCRKRSGLCPVELHGQSDLPPLRIGIRLHMIRIDLRKHLQRHAAGDAVPVGLGVRRGEMSALGGIAGVFHTDHDLHQRFRHICRNLIDVGRAQAVAAAHTPAVDPQRGNTGALQRQLHGKSEKIGIEVNGFPKPCLPLKCIGVGQESGLPCRIGGSFFGERGGAGERDGVGKSCGNLFPCHLRQREFPDTAEVITCDHMFDSFQKFHIQSVAYPGYTVKEPAQINFKKSEGWTFWRNML